MRIAFHFVTGQPFIPTALSTTNAEAEALAKATREVDERRGRRSWIMIFVVILLICACVVFGIHLCTFFRVGNPSDESSSEDSVDSSFSPPTPGPISHTIFPWSRPRG